MTLAYRDWAKINYRSKKARIKKKQAAKKTDDRYVDYCIRKAKQSGEDGNQALFDGVFKHAIEEVFGRYHNTLENLADSGQVIPVHLEEK